MAFRPQVNDQLTINNVTYSIVEHPAAPGVPYGQAGRRAIVYQVVAGEDYCALKVFSRRFRTPALVLVAQNLAPYASWPGLQVCRREVITPERNSSLLQQHPDLAYAVLMPWIKGPTWMETMIQKQALTSEESLALARSLVEILTQMEKKGLAHCDLSGPNVMLPPEGGVALVDVEEMYGPEFERPEALPSGTWGYGHRTAGEGLWGANADRFAGAVLLAEVLGWCDERVREAAWGEQYFDKEEVQKGGERYRLLVEALRDRWGERAAALFEQAWQSETLQDCPTFGEWLRMLPEKVGAATALVRAEPGIDEEQAEAPEPGWKVVGEEAEEKIAEPERTLPPDVQGQLVQARLLAGKALLQARQPEQAVSELEAAYEMNPEAAGELLARALIAQAQEREEDGDIDGAMEDYRRAADVASGGSTLREEVSRLSNQMHEAFNAGQFQVAMTVGERLLELDPEHSEGARLMEEAQAKLAKRHDLVEQLERERVALGETQRELETQRARLTEQRAKLEAKQEKLATERTEAERRLKELEQTLVRYEKNKTEVQEQLQILEKEREKVDRRVVQLDQTAGLLARGELEQAERLLIQPSESSTEPHPGPDMVPARTEQLAPGAGFWGSLAGLVLFCSIAVFSAGDSTGGSIFLLIAIVLATVALVRSQSSNVLPHPEKSEENQA